ncbi:MAG: hypothetical protein R6V75_09125 [Bacteroidales bacterium]
MISNLKSRLLILALGLLPLPGIAQISLVQSFSYSGTFTRLENGDFRFFLMDVPASECRIYKPDFSLDKRVKLDVPANRWLSDIKYLSRNLFNTDEKMEMLYVYYQYVETATSYYYIYTTRVADESGQVLLDVPGGSYAEVKAIGPTQSVLLVYVSDYSIYPYTVETRLYSIPGMLTGLEPTHPDPASLADPVPYPNPASGRVTVPFPQQIGSNRAELLILDDSGRVVHRGPLDGPLAEVDIRSLGLPDGVYFYKLISPFYQTKPQKIVHINQ